LKNSTSVRHRQLMKVAQDCEHRILLTGAVRQPVLPVLLVLPVPLVLFVLPMPLLLLVPPMPLALLVLPMPLVLLVLPVPNPELTWSRLPIFTHPPGTPLQNDLGELLALLRFLMPSLFGSSLDLDDEAILGAELEAAARDEQVCGGGGVGCPSLLLLRKECGCKGGQGRVRILSRSARLAAGW